MGERRLARRSESLRWFSLFESSKDGLLGRDQLGAQGVCVWEFRQVFGREDFGVDAAGGVLHDGVVLVASQDDADRIRLAGQGHALLGGNGFLRLGHLSLGQQGALPF
jgi:hypothetical protein